MHDIAIIIPAYNEELTIRETMQAFHRQMPGAALYVIDNNSSDRTNAIAAETLSSLGGNGKVFFEKRQGKANAVRRAFCEIDAAVYVMVDADLTYPPEELPRLIEPVIRGEADMVIGDRHAQGGYAKENKRPFHHFGNNLVKNMINFLFKSQLNDIMSGYRVFSRKFLKNYPILCEGFEIETEMTLHALDKKFRIREIPIHYKDRPVGSSSKLNTYRDGFKVLKTIFWIFKDYKPLVFFSTLSVLFFIVGFLIGLPVLDEYYATHYIKRVPSAILATGMMIFSLLFLSVGLILETIVKFHRFDYEMKLLAYRERKLDG